MIELELIRDLTLKAISRETKEVIEQENKIITF